MRFIASIFLLFSSLACFGQEKSSNHDLRSKLEIFQISHIGSKLVFRLESSNSGEFSYQLNDVVTKIDSTKANKLDQIFADSFLSMKYMMQKPSRSDCKKEYALSMRGEKFNICKDDEIRIQIISKFISKLKNI